MRAPPGAAVLTLARSACHVEWASEMKRQGGGVGQREQGAGASRGDPCLGARNGRLFEDSKTLLRDPYPAEKRRSPTKEAYAHPPH